MFREMRRNKQLLSQEDTIAVLERGTNGILAVSGDDDYPYAVPLSYIYHDSRIYFHCAKTGHKLDSIKRNPRVSFCVVDKDQIASEEFTTYFRSVIAFGQARILDDPEEKRRAIRLLASKYSPEEDDARLEKEIDGSFSALCIVEITLEHLTGKEAIELVRAKER